MNLFLLASFPRQRLCLLSIGFVLALNGCVGITSKPNEIINELIIRNDTNQSMYDVVLRVVGTHIIVSTNMILPYRDYGLGFPQIENERRVATLSWKHNNTPYTREIRTIIPDDIDATTAAKSYRQCW